MEKYRFGKYNPKFARYFELEKKRLLKIVPNAKIEHIGSTAIQGLGGKGIVDILIGVDKKRMVSLKELLTKNGYACKESVGSGRRLFFEKSYGLIFKRKVHLQLTWLDSSVWRDALKFKDKLIISSTLLKEYADINKEATNLGLEGKEYRDYKRKFIEGVLR